MYAVIKTGGKQYRVAPSEVILVEKVEKKEGDSIEFSEVLLVSDGDQVSIGTPYIAGVSVHGKVLGQEKGEKVVVAKFKAKVRYRRRTGHRQMLTRVQIVSIGKGVKQPEKGKEKVKNKK